MDEIRVEHSQNVIAGSTVSANGDVLVGGQKVINYFYSAPYQDLKKQSDELQAQFSKTRQKTEKYPDDEDFKTELLQIDEKRNEVQKKLDDLKGEVIRLTETFAKIPINTERLKFAREHFEMGDYAAARAVLDAEQMGHELDALLGQKEQLQHQQAENESNLIDKANEFLILARLTAVDFTRADRYDKAVEYFEQSLKAARTVENTFAYAYFLQQHNQFIAALPFYTQALEIYRRLADANPQTWLPDVAVTLNNLALLQRARNEFTAAEAGYREALAIYRPLAEVNPQTWLPDVAVTLNNLANLQ
ncbi:MAG: tetratricopeptide repeat protein, partial [Nitrosospira sp.]|nr:tetratricopeptide repeat protein [Nitrosospira sp.]